MRKERNSPFARNSLITVRGASEYLYKRVLISIMLEQLNKIVQVGLNMLGKQDSMLERQDKTIKRPIFTSTGLQI